MSPDEATAIAIAGDALSQAIETARPALKWIRNHTPVPDPHCLSDHASIALDALAAIEPLVKILRSVPR